MVFILVDVKFAENDIVKFRFGRVAKTTCTCDFCASSGMIRGMDGTEEECPRCDGRGYIELRNYQETEEENAIKEIKVKWNRQSKPQVCYIMSGWDWSQQEIPQEDIIRKIGEYKWTGDHFRKELASKERR